MTKDRGSPTRRGSLRARGLDLKAVMGWRKVTKRLSPVTESGGLGTEQGRGWSDVVASD